MKTKAKKSKIAIILETIGADEDDIMDGIDRLLDAGTIQDEIRERLVDMDQIGKKFNITSASVRPAEFDAADQRDALAAELVQYARALVAMDAISDPRLVGILKIYDVDPRRVRGLGVVCQTESERMATAMGETCDSCSEKATAKGKCLKHYRESRGGRP